MLVIGLLFVPYLKATNADNDYVILGGESIGLNLSTGVKISGKYQVDTDDGKISPWESSNILVDDFILKFDGKDVSDISSLHSIINEIGVKDEVEIVLKRNQKILKTKIDICKNKKGAHTIGLYVKDKVIGVGTITYYTLDSHYGALGHGALESEMRGNIGNIMPSSVSGIKKAVEGVPGEKKAELENVTIGTIEKNTNIGVFGKFKNTNLIKNNKVVEVAEISEISLGKGEIITVIDGKNKESFAIEITYVDKQSEKDIKGIKFRVTDEELLEKTGGIIQGMSGSPIVQNGKLIGAVSHVIVDNPTNGYGVFAKWMITE